MHAERRAVAGEQKTKPTTATPNTTTNRHDARAGTDAGDRQSRTPDVIYVPTPPEVVEAMLKVAGVGKDDICTTWGAATVASRLRRYRSTA